LPSDLFGQKEPPVPWKGAFPFRTKQFWTTKEMPASLQPLHHSRPARLQLGHPKGVFCSRDFTVLLRFALERLSPLTMLLNDEKSTGEVIIKGVASNLVL
jgi:hypothetical protein